METISVALICTVLGTAISYLTFKKGQAHDIRAETREDAYTMAKLDYISKGVDDIRLDIKAQDTKINDINTRVTRVEESVKSAHHRLDNLEKGED